MFWKLKWKLRGCYPLVEEMSCDSMEQAMDRARDHLSRANVGQTQCAVRINRAHGRYWLNIMISKDGKSEPKPTTDDDWNGIPTSGV